MSPRSDEVPKCAENVTSYHVTQSYYKYIYFLFSSMNVLLNICYLRIHLAVQHELTEHL